MSNLAEIQAKIAELQAQEAQIRQQEYAQAVESAQALINTHKILLKDLKFSAASTDSEPVRGKRASSGQKAPIKYRDENGNTWSGRGLKPKWLSSALDSGRKLEDFLVS